LKQIAAAGKKPGEFFTVSVWDPNRALESAACSVVDRIAFKSSLDRAAS
jgi:hypothetical protein